MSNYRQNRKACSMRDSLGLQSLATLLLIVSLIAALAYFAAGVS